MSINKKSHSGNWLPKNKNHIAAWIKDQKTRIDKNAELVQPVKEFQ